MTVRIGNDRRTRRLLGRWGEALIEGVIRFCGVSAILCVFAIFVFVFREGAGYLFGGFDPVEFFTSTAWYPTSQSRVRYGVLALLAGTASVTLFAMALAVPFGLGAAIFVSEFCSPRLKETFKIVIDRKSVV